jgi:AcrR family transcriptional regulator
MSRAASVPSAPAPDSSRARQIRSAAAELFFSKGYEAATLRDIARALGLRSATLYYYFPDKEAILFELCNSTMEELTEGAETVLGEEKTAETKLAGFVVNHIVAHALRPRETTLGDTELRSLTGARRKQVQGLRDRYEALLVDLLEEGGRLGAFEPLDVKLSAYAVLAQCTNVGIWFRGDGRLDLDAVCHVYANAALRVAGGPSASEPLVRRLCASARRRHEEAT